MFFSIHRVFDKELFDKGGFYKDAVEGDYYAS